MQFSMNRSFRLAFVALFSLTLLLSGFSFSGAEKVASVAFCGSALSDVVSGSMNNEFGTGK